MDRLIESMVRDKINNGLVEEELYKDEFFAESKRDFEMLLDKLKDRLDRKDIFDLEAECNAIWVSASEIAYRAGLQDGLKLKG